MAAEKHVGILALEVYTPRTYVAQSKLEAHDGVPAGKYTIGLGQESIGLVAGDAEDVNSIALTVVRSLLEKYAIDPGDVGRLEVGTETLVDKSKSTKTVLMSLFGDNADVEGVTTVNACYGGTAALLNAFAWVESDGWDGRYAIVVAADIAAYAKGPARPTSGAGAVAVLVGRDAPLAFDPRERTTHAAHVWDFFKPDHRVEYPTVDGALSQVCYYRALEDCYARFAAKMEGLGGGGDVTFDAESADHFVFHAPYNKLVQKSYGRMHLLDARRARSRGGAGDDHPLARWLEVPIEDTYADKALEKELKKISAASFAKRLGDANTASRVIGNTYAASVFVGLASLVDRIGRDDDGAAAVGRTVVVFSYGSGAMASMYRLRVRAPSGSAGGGRFTVGGMARAMDLSARLAARVEVDARELDEVMDCRERMHGAGSVPYAPAYEAEGRLFPGTYYLAGIDGKWTRRYERLPP